MMIFFLILTSPQNFILIITLIIAFYMINRQLNETELEEVYNWVDQIPLSRPKRNMARDFSDAEVLLAEIVHHFSPKLVEMHNYNAASSVKEKLGSWQTLNRKVLSKLKINLLQEEIQMLANSAPGFVEKLIFRVKKYVQSTEINSPSTVSKANTHLSFASNVVKSKPLNKLSYKEIKGKKPVKELITAKNQEIQLLKEQIQLYLAKANKLEDILKCKDHEIEELVKIIRDKKIN